MPVELRHLRSLVALAEELHFGRAAIRLNISQPPLSQQIKQLEEELAVRLFHRTKREVRLTQAGKRIVTEAYQVLSQFDHLTRVAAQAGQGEIGHLSVGMPSGLNEILTETLKLFARRYPGIHLELRHMTTAEQIEALHEGRIHAGFLNLPVQGPELILETVRSEPLCIAMTRGHVLARQQRVSVEDLKGQDIVMFSRRVSPGLHDVITGMCQNAGFSLNAVHETDNVVASLTLVSAELGICFCTPSLRALWPDLVVRPVINSAPVEQAVAYRQHGHTPVLEIFLNILRQVAGKESRRPR
jgi:DNA-binding transcriptional LysR family regulator